MECLKIINGTNAAVNYEAIIFSMYAMPIRDVVFFIIPLYAFCTYLF